MIAPSFEVSFTDDGAELTASQGDSYQWYLDGQPIEGATEQTYLAQETGDYAVEVGIDFPCSDASSSTFVVVSSLHEQNGNSILLFPNPMTTSAILDVGELRGPAILDIYDVSGKLIRQENVNLDSGVLIIERGRLSSGSYLLRLSQNGQQIESPFLVE